MITRKMRSMLVRKAAAGDIPEILALDRRSGLPVWQESDYAAFIRRPTWDVLVAANAVGLVVGFLVNQRAGPEAELVKIVVAPESRGAGVGQALLQAGLQIVRQAGCCAYFLEVRPSNAAALSLYRKNGFVESGLRKEYYQDPTEPALLMRRDL